MVFKLYAILGIFFNVLFILKILIMNESSKASPHTYFWLNHIYNSVINCIHNILRVIIYLKDISLTCTKETFTWIFTTFEIVGSFASSKIGKIILFVSGKKIAFLSLFQNNNILTTYP